MTPVERAEAALEAIAASDRPEAWISVAPQDTVLMSAAAVNEAAPLAGLTLAVKDNIDVAGLPTTAGCPSYAYMPERSAPVVARLEAAGAVVVGKTNLDQFATGLVGTRSPYGAVRNAFDPSRVAGGSSSGSAVAVALGLVDLALGTDTAGSGRVPAAFNGVVGFKPTRGLLPAAGVVPACRSLDCISIFSATVADAWLAVQVAQGVDPADPYSRNGSLLGPKDGQPRIGVPLDGQLADLETGYRKAYVAAIDQAGALGWELVPIDIGPYLAAGRLLYNGAFVAERYSAVGEFLAREPADADPTVAAIIAAAGRLPAHELAADQTRLAALRRVVERWWPTLDALLLPTAPRHPTIADVAIDPIGSNAALGVYTNGCNLLDLAAVAVPAAIAPDSGLQFGVTLCGPAWSDAVLAALASRFASEAGLPGEPEPVAVLELVVVGAHLSGQPLNHELVERGGRLVCRTTTAPAYRLFALATTPPKPGLVRARQDGAAIEAEVWALPTVGFADFVTKVPAPLAIGQVELANNETRSGFVCQPHGLDGAEDITHHGSWRNYIAARAPKGPT